MTNHSPVSTARPLRWVWPAGLCIFAATLAAYWPAVRAGYVWNDSDYVTAPALRSVDGLRRIWCKVGATQQYYPALHSAFWVEHRLWGDAAMGYHLATIFLHATAACLFALILRRLWATGETPARPDTTGPSVAERASVSPVAPWLAALVFALHPVCVESVAWISEQKNTLSTVFYLLAALAYLHWKGMGDGMGQAVSDPSSPSVAARKAEPRLTGNGSPCLYLLAIGLFILALLSKSMAATLPAALLVVLWWKHGRLGWKADVWPLIPWFVLGAAGGLFTGWVERTYIGAQGSDFAFSLGERSLIAGRVVWFYLGKLLWPADLIFIYPRWHVDAGVWWQYLFPLGAIAFTAVLWAVRGKARGPLAGWLVFVGSLFPILGFLNVYAFVFSFVADHWQYLASMGVIAVVAAGWDRWAAPPADGRSSAPVGRIRSISAWLAAAAVAGALGALTWRECRNYRDMETFYRTILARNPACWMAHNNLGFTLEGEGKMAEAMPHFAEALRLRPQYTEAHNNYAAALLATGRPAEAIIHCEAALRLLPSYAQAHNNLGNALSAVGRMPEAIAHYREAMRLDPNYADAPYNLGVTLAGLGRLAEAADYYERAIRIRPGYAEAYNNLGNVRLRSGRLPDAIAAYRQALQGRQDYADAHVNLGIALERSGKPPAEAMIHYQAALRITPDDAKAHYYLGNVFSGAGRRTEAMAEYEAAVLLEPRFADAHNNLGAMLYVMGRPAEAMAQVARAVELAPDYIDAHNNLGLLLEKAGRNEEARAQFEIVARLKSAK